MTQRCCGLFQVVYVTATLPYLLLTVILIKGLTLPGATDGILFYIRPDFNKLANLQVSGDSHQDFLKKS